MAYQKPEPSYSVGIETKLSSWNLVSYLLNLSAPF